jgi:hypothetical protein
MDGKEQAGRRVRPLGDTCQQVPSPLCGVAVTHVLGKRMLSRVSQDYVAKNWSPGHHVKLLPGCRAASARFWAASMPSWARRVSCNVYRQLMVSSEVTERSRHLEIQASMTGYRNFRIDAKVPAAAIARTGNAEWCLFPGNGMDDLRGPDRRSTR